MYRTPTGDVIANTDVYFSIANKLKDEIPLKVKLYIFHENYDIEIYDMKFEDGHYQLRKHFPEGHYRYAFEFICKDKPLSLFFGADEKLGKSIPVAFHLEVTAAPTIKERIQKLFNFKILSEC